MFQRILVPLDGSALAEQAIPTAGRIARATGGSVVLVQVISPLFEYGYGPYLLQPPCYMDDLALRDDLSEATLYLERVAASIHLAGVETDVEACYGSAAAMILAAPHAKNLVRIVVCTHR